MTRLLFLLAALAGADLWFAPAASAQNGLANLPIAVGTRWDDISASVPLPDSGAVANDAGTLRWTAPEEEVVVLYAIIERGTLRRVEVMFAAGTEPDRRIADMLLQLKESVGPPADPPFFSAQQFFDVSGSSWIDLWVDTGRRRLVFRQPADPPPAAPPRAVPPPPPPPQRVK